MHTRSIAVALVIATACAAQACAQTSASPSSTTSPPATTATSQPPAATATSQQPAPTATSPPQAAHHHVRRRHLGPPRAAAPRPGLLPVSHASSTVVQPQPKPGTCHATGSGVSSEPDASCTPGARNPAVTQATIGATICMSGYSKSVRPSEHITAAEKLGSMAAYGDSGSPSAFEYDHLVSLELGGAPNDPRNLWPEPGGSPNPKDSVENALHRLVCSGEMPLSQAQKIIATGWVAYARSHG